MARNGNSNFGKGTGTFICRVCGHKTRQTGGGDNEYVELCSPCYKYAGWENTHSDENHKANPDKHCPLCKGITDLEYAKAARGEKAK
jgi:rubrerythrin